MFIGFFFHFGRLKRVLFLVKAPGSQPPLSPFSKGELVTYNRIWQRQVTFNNKKKAARRGRLLVKHLLLKLEAEGKCMPELSHTFFIETNGLSIFIETARLEVTCIDLIDEVPCNFVLKLGVNFPASAA